jgi:ubiquinone/menaquinone biosynthesis C-methylase UbiE
MNAVKSALSPFYRVLELAGGFALHQKLGEKTLERYRQHIARNLPATADKHVLDIGCGIGSFRPCFAGAYTGIDINPAYIEEARERYAASFEAMDCTRLRFEDRSFDEVVTIATLHHIDDGEVARMVAEAIRVCRPGGYFHIIDAILPLAPNLFKTVLFRLDRGNHPRTLAQHLAVIGRAGRILEHQVLTGPLHDTAYVRVARSGA